MDTNNWAGSVARAPAGRRFIGIQAQWIVTEVTAPDDGTYEAWQWVGLGSGKAGGLFQAGTISKIVRDRGPATPAEHFLWCEWVPQGASRIDEVAVQAGDLVIVNLALRSPTSGDVTITVSRSDGSPVGSVSRHPSFIDLPAYHIDGSTVEWVVERGMEPDSPALFPLANFGKRVFGPGSNWAALDDHSYVQMRNGTLNTMVNGAGNALTTVTIAPGSKPLLPLPALPYSEDVLTVQWLGAK